MAKSHNSDKEKKVETTDEVVKDPNEGVKAPVKAEKKAKALFNVTQFCNIKGVKKLDAWVAKRFFPNDADMKSENEWKKEFDKKQIPFKK